MSHQSLKDLTDVTGSPSDGQILKYNSGAWGPADESGGGSSGAEYLEIYEEGDSLSKGTFACLVGGGTLLHNSISSSDAYRKDSAPSGIQFDSKYDSSDFDSLFFFHKSATSKYLLECDYMVKHANTSDHVWNCHLGGEVSTSSLGVGFGAYTNQTAAYRKLHSVNDVHTSNGSFSIAAGAYQRLVFKHIYTVNLSNSTQAVTFGPNLFIGDSSPYLRLAGHMSATSGLDVVYRHVKVTKIA
jgi:hypothetical protein